MRIEELSIHSPNHVLAGLRDTRGNPCGEEVLRRALNTDIFVILGEPAIGKSTVTEQTANELRLRNVPYEIVAYDNVLENYIKETGRHEESIEFNKRLVQKVLEARVRLAPRRGVVIFDTCAVGNKTPKDRSVTAIESLVKLTKEGNPFFSRISILALIGSLYNQYQHGRIRSAILDTPPHLLIARLKDEYNIAIEGIPSDVSHEEVTEGIQTATRRTAQYHHIVAISMEVLLQNLRALEGQDAATIYRIAVPKSIRKRDRLLTRMKVTGMRRITTDLGISDDEWLTAINPETDQTVTWYAEQFLRRENN